MVAANSPTVSAMMSATGRTASMRPATWPDEGDRRLHVAAEVEGPGVAELAEHVVLGVLDSSASVRSVRSARSAGGVALVEEHRVGLGGVDDRLLPVVVHRRLGGRHHAGAHLHALGAERERGRHRARRRRCRRRR